MNAIKRFYIIPFLFACFIATAHAIFIILTTDNVSLAWLSVVISCGTMLGFMVYLGVAGVSSTSRRMPVQLSGALIGAVLAIVYFELLPSLYTLIIGGVGVFAYVFWYSDLGRSDSPSITVGEKIPAFELEGENGQVISSADFIGHPTIYLFYRGSWCPLCVAQIKELGKQYQALKTHGVEAVMISPQSLEDTKKLAHQFDVPLVFAFDRDGSAAKKLGILHQSGIPAGMSSSLGADTVFPTAIITDDKGDVLWSDQTDNYRVRPDPDMFIEVLNRHYKNIGQATINL